MQSVLYTVFAFRRVYRMAMAHARERGLSYEWFVRLRPDIFFTRPPPLLLSLPRTAPVVFVGSQWPTDYVAVGRASVMRVYFTVADGFNRSDYTFRLNNTWQAIDAGWFDNLWGTEELIIHWLDMHGILTLAHPELEASVLRLVRDDGRDTSYSLP